MLNMSMIAKQTLFYVDASQRPGSRPLCAASRETSILPAAGQIGSIEGVEDSEVSTHVRSQNW